MGAGDLAGRIAAVLGIDANANAVEFEGRWVSWGELAASASEAQARVARPGMSVGVILRNTPSSVARVLGVLMARGCVVTINPGRGVERVREDLASLGLPLVLGDAHDLDAVARNDTTAGTATDRPGVAVRMLTSGTTGPPKRIDLTYETFDRVLVGAKHYESDRDFTPRLRNGVAIVNAPLAHVGGMFRVLQCVTDGRAFCLLDRFTVDGWLDAVRRHRPATTSLVPAALRMVLDADIDRDDLSSLRSVISGTAPLDPVDADAFFQRYGVPVLISYGATEFGGGVAGWNLADHQMFWSAKRGSVGRAHEGCSLRVVDPDTGAVLDANREGVLEIDAEQLRGQPDGQGWVRTTDLARIDEDGFVWILGRTDQAIVRGGFKVLPDDVRVALERHPAVRGAAVVRRDDRRLGQVPVAAVELRPSTGSVTAAELTEFLSSHLARYELPAEIRIVDSLPRTDSGKADLAAVSALFD